MAGNETINLSVADSDTAELELFLYDDRQNLVDADGGAEANQTLTVPAPGDSFVVVMPAAGASNYTLTVGQNLSGAARGPRLSDPFAAGQVLVTTDGSAVGSEYELQQLSRAGTVHLMALTDVTAAMRTLGKRWPQAGRWSPEQAAKRATLAMIEALKADPRVQWAEPNYLRFAQAEPNDPLYGSQWHYPIINLPLAWDITTGAAQPGENSVIVAVIDSGILPDHPDLDDQLVPGHSSGRERRRVGHDSRKRPPLEGLQPVRGGHIEGPHTRDEAVFELF